ncbi:uncharacterized protein LOC121378232 [Gigantopelta aegis]|uniref:uncharacterized protein LOC121378232 n=1 Tax=Gigantopelta aegis TaxID=1735272 RepID=UPI001B88BE2E|nr:uncharacterized protein LOC121378232 [Gigantopelta aegis]
MRSDPSKDSELKDILGAAIGGGGAFLLVMLIVIGCVVMRRKKDKKRYMKSMQSYTSEPAPFMSAMEHVPYLAHKSHYLNPVYDNRDVMDFYDPMGSGMFDRPYNAVTPKEDDDLTDPSVYRSTVGSTSPKHQGLFVD